MRIGETAERVPDPEDIGDIAKITSNQLQTAIGVIVPTDRDLLDPITEPLGNREYLNVEHVPIYTLTPEQIASHVALKKLESALCVRYARQSHYQVHEDAESPGSDTPI